MNICDPATVRYLASGFPLGLTHEEVRALLDTQQLADALARKVAHLKRYEDKMADGERWAVLRDALVIARELHERITELEAAARRDGGRP